jgi:hypothetical protein
MMASSKYDNGWSLVGQQKPFAERCHLYVRNAMKQQSGREKIHPEFLYVIIK